MVSFSLYVSAVVDIRAWSRGVELYRQHFCTCSALKTAQTQISFQDPVNIPAKLLDRNNSEFDSDDVDVSFDGDDFCDDYDDEADDEDEQQNYKGQVRGVSEDMAASMDMEY